MNDLKAVSLYQPSFITLPDTLIQADTVVQTDTNNISDYLNDTVPQITKKADSTVKAHKEHTTIEAKVERTARDSIVQDIAHKKVYMYGDAVITYENITIKADYIEVDFNTNSLYATGLPDSTGKLRGVPEFTEDNETFKAKTMTYNFKTKEGIIKNVLTEDDLGFLHGQKVKKMDDEISSNEPALAFDGGMLGIKLIQKLISESPRLLKKHGWVAFEIGIGQGPFVLKFMKKSDKFSNIGTASDVDGNVRVIFAQKA